MLPRAFGQTVVAGQRIWVGTQVGDTLHIVVAAENVGAAPFFTDVTQCQLQDARRAGHVVTNGVLGLTHAPHNRAGTVVRHRMGCFVHFSLRNARHLFDVLGIPLLHDFVFDLVHAPDAVIDVALVFPAIFEDVVDQTKQERDVGA